MFHLLVSFRNNKNSVTLPDFKNGDTKCSAFARNLTITIPDPTMVSRLVQWSESLPNWECRSHFKKKQEIIGKIYKSGLTQNIPQLHKNMQRDYTQGRLRCPCVLVFNFFGPLFSFKVGVKQWVKVITLLSSATLANVQNVSRQHIKGCDHIHSSGAWKRVLPGIKWNCLYKCSTIEH